MANAEKAEDIVLCFGPKGAYKLHIPMGQVEDIRQTAYTFMEAGVALKLFADEQGVPTEPAIESQLFFDWANAG